MTFAQNLLPEFDEEFANTRKILSLVPNDKLMWKPHDKSMELGRLAWHLSDFPEWVVSVLGQTELTMGGEGAAQSDSAWQGKTSAEIVARLDADLPRARALLEGASDADLAVRWKMVWGGQTIIDDPRLTVYRKWTINHMIHHRA